jgi:hypothetical protein
VASESVNEFAYSADGMLAWTRDRRYVYQRQADGSWGPPMLTAEGAPAAEWGSGAAARTRLGGGTWNPSPTQEAMTAYHRATKFQRGWASYGVAAGFLSGILWGLLALNSLFKWRDGRISRPTFAWVWAWIFTGLLGLGIIGLLLDPSVGA